jgi:endonuclease/exonuclease/phosphatase family metal-dependent hydrolase
MASKSLLVMSFNLRLDTPVDGANRFIKRAGAVIDHLNQLSPDIIGFQEVTPEMTEELKRGMPNYRFVGEYRSLGAEGVPICYRLDRFEFVQSRTFWLTSTPSKESKDNDSNYPRIATILELRAHNDRLIRIMNTHLDYASSEVALRQISIALKIFQPGETAIVTGDFNQGPDSEAVHQVLAYGMSSVYVHPSSHHLTFHGYTEHVKGNPIDYIFHSADLTLVETKIDRFKPSFGYLSDHYPIIAKWKW